jgi:hypothetical protein
MVLVTGQSLARGTMGSPALTTTAQYDPPNYAMHASATRFITLVEDTGVETPASGIANNLSYQSPLRRWVVNWSAQGGAAYSTIKKGTSIYNANIDYATRYYAMRTMMGGFTPRVMGVFVAHGEQDANLGKTLAEYQASLEEWQTDYDLDLKAITGQSETVKMFVSQMSSFHNYGGVTGPALAQLAAALANPTKIYLTGPKYQRTYADTAHLTAASYRADAALTAKVMHQVLVLGQPWLPLYPTAAVRTANVIDVTFHVPVGPLVFDTTAVLAKTNMGFEYTDDSSPPAISSVAILSATQVRITLASTPVGANPKVRYALSGTNGANPGAQVSGSARGNLRDSDPWVSRDNEPAPNWCVHFEVVVN